MNKLAYFKLMGLNKVAAPAKPASGYFDNLKRVYNTAIAAGKDNPGDIMKTLAYAHSMPGELSTWQYIWNLIKSWFGSKQGAAAIRASDFRDQSITNVNKRLNTYYKGISQHLSPADQSAVSDVLNATKERYVNRGIQSGKLTEQAFGKLSPNTKIKKQDLRNWFIGRGQQRRHQDAAPKSLVLPGATSEQMKILQPMGQQMTSVKPSWRNRLSGENMYA